MSFDNTGDSPHYRQTPTTQLQAIWKLIGDDAMKLSDIKDLLQHYHSPGDWMRVDNESRDGGDTLVCLEDVLLCIKFNLVWSGNKPFTRLELTYGSTLLSWADLPIGPQLDRPSHADAVQALLKRLGAPGR